MAGRVINPPEPTYYRDRKDLRMNTPAQPENPGAYQQPVPNGPVVLGEADASSVGPLRALFGRSVIEHQVPCAVTPLGVNNQPVQLVYNDNQAPMYVRIRLARNSTEGRMLISSQNAISGQGGSQPAEWLDLTVQPGRMFEALLKNGEMLYAIGSWAGIVPLFIFVTVSAWNP